MNKLLNMLGITKRAGKLVLGFDPVKASIQTKLAQIVLVASDISPKTLKEVEFLLKDNNNIKLLRIDYTGQEIAYAVGKKSAVMSCTDAGLGNKITSLIAPIKEEN